MRLPALLSLSWLAASGAAFAAFAPIPEIEKGQPVVVDLRGGVLYDSNIFGDDEGAVDSLVYTLSPQLRLNASLTQQTFLRGVYSLEVQQFDDRPGDDTLFNHLLGARLSHSVSERAEITLYENLAIVQSPEAALTLGGIREEYQADQSFWSNVLGATGTVDLSRRLELEPGLRVFGINYDNAVLAGDLDHVRWDASSGLAYRYWRTTRLVAEGRYRKVRYDVGDAFKGSETLYALAGFNYDLEERTALKTRLGVEARERNAGGDTSRLYGEASLRHSYAENSWVQAGVEYSLQETDAIGDYLDSSGPVFVLTGQVDPSGADTLLFTGTISYALRTLNARPGASVGDADEESLTLGFAAILNIREQWSIRATLDYQDKTSDVPGREQERLRTGIVLNYTFGLFD